MRLPQSIQFLNNDLLDETYASAFSLGLKGFNSGRDAGSTELREHLILSMSGIEDATEFEEMETLRTPLKTPALDEAIKCIKRHQPIFSFSN